MERKTEITMAQVMLPAQANPAGNIHGGEIMKLMDTVAGATATQYSKANVVTARVDEIQFILPIKIGNFVTCTGKLAYIGTSSMEVIVNVDVEDLGSNEGPKRALSSFFTMVALDEDGKPMKVKPLEHMTPEQEELRKIVEARRANYKRARQAAEEACHSCDG